MHLPPLNALRAFEAAARHRSFARAAEELHVSQGAISRHVKLLEEHFGVLLFRRLARGLKPTEAATQLLPRASAAFAMIEQAATAIGNARSEIRILASPTLANRWLIPRLRRFTEQAPEISVSVGVLRSSYREFYSGDYDVGVATFYMPADWPDDLRAERIRGEELTPICAPPLLEGDSALRTPADLNSHTLLRITACRYDWPKWLEANGYADIVDAGSGPSYETGELAIRAAVEGLGVVMMDQFLVERELQAGVLVDPFPSSKPVDNGYYFFCDRSRSDDPLIKAFRNWLLAEVARPD